MTDPIIIKARQLFVERNHLGLARERGALGGAYDTGTDILQYYDEAAAILLREKEEANDE